MTLFGVPPATVLVVAPHADDEVLGCGGLLTRLARAGWRVHVAYVTVAGFASQSSGVHASHEERRREAEAARRVIGAASHDVLFADGAHHLQLDQVPSSQIIAFVERQMNEIGPRVLLAPAEGHFHQDHRATSAACMAALRPGSKAARDVDVALAYGPSHVWWGNASGFANPDLYVDISKTIEDKLKALACYKSQIGDFPHPRSLDAVRAYARTCGAAIGVDYAEPYAGLRTIIR